MNHTESGATVQHRDYETEIVAILRSNLSPNLKQEQILAYHQNDIASAMAILSVEERRKLYSILGLQALPGILEYSENINVYLSELSSKGKVSVLSRLEASVAAEYLNSLDKAERHTLIQLLDEQTKQDISLLDSFDDQEIGSRMTTNYVSVRMGITVRQAMRRLVEQAADNDNISTIYVTDGDDTFVGAIDLKDLIIAREGTELSSIMLTSYPYVYTYELINDCIERIREYSEDSIPVLDTENKLQGVLISQDITDLVDKEMSEDYAKLAGLSAEEDLREPLKQSIGKRLPWLIILLGLGLVVSAVVGLFESIVEHVAIIVSFQSLILGMSGNVGTQSLAVTIRVLMDEQLSAKKKWFLVGKEARVGLINGVILGACSLLLVGAYLMLLKEQPPTFSFCVSACTALALLVAVLLSSLTGTVIPIILKKSGVDPAVASGPLITTVNDLVAVVSYYGLAWLLLIVLLGF
ncbi:MAG: magnesium transporter [Clostridia bacterium]|nr:magnesium transporter [Clostridia bacterium]